jgi:hypothetical protein
MKIKLINSEHWLDMKGVYKEGIDPVQVTFKADPPVTRDD